MGVVAAVSLHRLAAFSHQASHSRTHFPLTALSRQSPRTWDTVEVQVSHKSWGSPRRGGGEEEVDWGRNDGSKVAPDGGQSPALVFLLFLCCWL